MHSAIVGVAADQATGTVKFYINNSLIHSQTQTSCFDDGGTLDYVPIFAGFNTQQMVVNFGQDSSFAGAKTAQGNTDGNGIGDFYYAPPSGYLALCTKNIASQTNNCCYCSCCFEINSGGFSIM